MDEVPKNSNADLPLPCVAANALESPKKRRKIKLWILLGLGLVLLAVLIFNPFSLILFSVLVGSHQIKITEGKLQKPEIYRPVAERLAIYCQSDQSLFPQILSYAWLPSEISSLGQPWCEVTTNGASVEFGGGFYHFGYGLELNQAASDTRTNVWNLFLVREESPDKPLMSLWLATTQHVTSGDLEKLVSASFDQLIKDGQPEGYVGKVMLQLRFGQTAQAAATCEDWMKARPDSWKARLTYAHIRCRLGEIEPADTQFSKWVHANRGCCCSSRCSTRGRDGGGGLGAEPLLAILLRDDGLSVGRCPVIPATWCISANASAKRECNASSKSPCGCPGTRTRCIRCTSHRCIA